MISTLHEIKDDFIFLVDSGAYTAYTRGQHVDLEKYLTVVNELVTLGFNLSGYFTLDVIGDHKKTKENFYIIKNAGYDPIPIFTRGAPKEDLEEYFEHADLVALGNVFGSGLVEHQYMKAVMTDWVRGRKVHWLGYSKKDFLLYFKPYQFDTSSFSSSVRFGNISLFINGHEYRLKRDDVKSWINQPGVRTLISRYGLDPDRFRHKEGWVNDGTYSEKSGILGHLSILSYCEYYYNLEKRGISRPFCAVTDDMQAKGVVECYKKILKLKEEK
jgi:hypothetical protein